TFAAWFKRYEDNFTVDAQQLDDAARVRFLLRKLDAAAHEKYANYILPRQPRDVNFNETVETLKDIFGPRISTFNQRYQCLKLIRSEQDDIVTYGGIVNREIEKFRLGELTPEHFKCLIFVCGLQSSADAEYRLHLLNRIDTGSNATLKDLIAEYRRLANLNRDTKMVERAGAASSTVNAVSLRNVRRPAKQSRTGRKPTNTDKLVDLPRTPCWQCGAMHYVKYCSFTCHKCTKCGNVGHKEGYCNCNRKRSKPSSRKQKPSLHSEGVCSVALTSDALQRRRYITAHVDGRPIRFQVNSGSDITILSRASWKHIGSPPLASITAEALDASNNPIKFSGQFDCMLEVNGRQASSCIFVGAGNNSHNLLGLDLIEKLDIWDLRNLCSNVRTLPLKQPPPKAQSPSSNELQYNPRQRYPEVFKETLGRCTKIKATLQLRNGAKPVFRPKRPVPYASREAVERELDRLAQHGVITKVEYSEWAAPIVVVKKASGAILICADYSTGLNDALELHTHPLPLPEDIFATLNGGRFFSHIDFADAYLQV
ncbi:hypothetical protein AB6A40_011595, partial [Gnathostoma spinigerum]